MSDIGSITRIVIVPKDPEKPIVGSFMLAHGDSLEWAKAAAKALGYTEKDYEFRRYLTQEEAGVNASKLTPPAKG